MKRQFTPPVGLLLQKLAPRIGATVLLEPNWKYAGQINFKNGRRRYFRYSTLDLNPVGASDIAKDKGYANFFMEEMGYPVIDGETFFSTSFARRIRSKQDIDAAYRYARTLGWPVIVKPNSGSQGQGVTLVQTKRDFYAALRSIFRQDKVALVQRKVTGRDYRVVVLDKRVISAYERIPLSVVGDGRSTILQLLKQKQKWFRVSGRDTSIKIHDPRISAKLRREGLSLNFRPVKGRHLFLLDNANLSTGGDSVDVTKKMHIAFRDIAINLTKDMGLRMCGVDFMVADSIENKPESYWIIEINAAPGLDHYAKSGRAQKKIVDDLYLEVLKSLER